MVCIFQLFRPMRLLSPIRAELRREAALHAALGLAYIGECYSLMGCLAVLKIFNGVYRSTLRSVARAYLCL